MTTPVIAEDLSHLPKYAFGARMTTWWGSVLLSVIEGTALALALGAYLYLALRQTEWPLSAPAPGLLWSTLITVLMLISIVPSIMLRSAAQKEDAPKVRILLLVMCSISTLTLVLRAFEFGTLNVQWHDNAYGSLVWFILGIHTTHILADTIDSYFVTALMWTGHDAGKRFSHVEDDMLFWWFVIGAWLPVYAVLYWFPRVWHG